MRWFKHFTDAGDDEVMAEMVGKFGMESYGLWWRILEIIARQMEKGSGRCSATYPKKKWRDLCSIYHQSRFDLVTIFLASREHPKLILSQSSDNLLTISCPKLLKFRDEYSRKSGQTPDKIVKVSGVCPTQDTETEIELDIKKERKQKDIAPTSGSEPPEQPFVTIPLNDKTEYPIYARDISAWQDTFPAVDVAACVKYIRTWNVENARKRKTATGIRKHITNWLAGEQNKGGGTFKRDGAGRWCDGI